MESVEIKGTLEGINLKDAAGCEIKIKAEYDDHLRKLIKQRVVLTVEPAVEQKPLPGTDKPAADPPGQARLFGMDNRPRYHVRCDHCNTETTQKLVVDEPECKTYECDACHHWNQVEAPKTAGQPDVAPEAEEPVVCSKCGFPMKVDEADESLWRCVNPDCQHTMTDETLELRNQLEEDPDTVPCHTCGAAMDYDEAQDLWTCSAEGCCAVRQGEQVREAMAKGPASEPTSADVDEFELLTCPDCESEMVHDRQNGILRCVNPECERTLSEDEARALIGQDDNAEPDLICPQCREHKMVKSDDGESRECAGDECGYWVTEEEAQRLLAEQKAAGDQVDADQDDDAGDGPGEGEAAASA
jgi:ssDNA-binding Zn-finger/Zn-ribbon topoisomerase 1